MSITARKVKNKKNPDGSSSNRAGTVYDVTLRYKDDDGIYQSYGKRGFLSKPDAQAHENEMVVKFRNPNYSPLNSAESKQTVREYMDAWVEQHGKANLRPSTFDAYKGYIRNHIGPHIGNVELRKLTPAMLDDMFQKMFDDGLSNNTVRYCQRIMSVALEAARKYRLIEGNPARDILTKFGKGGKTPDPYTVQQMQVLLSHILGTEWEIIIMLGGLYGLRLSEILGLRWRNVDLEKGTFFVCEQLPHKSPAGTVEIKEMAPVKSDERLLPITDVAQPYFMRQLQLIERQRELMNMGGGTYYENDLVIPKPNGAPRRRETVSSDFGQLLRKLELPHIRFHDLRHTAATNMHQLTGDFYTVSKILGHTLKGAGIQLGISSNLDTVTAQYVDVRIERMQVVLNAYHNALQPKKKGKAKLIEIA